ncbi:unnamed protein product [Parajaminaea phylloscopi]
MPLNNITNNTNRRRHTHIEEAQRLAIVSAFHDGMSIREVAQLHRVSKSAVHKIVQRFDDSGVYTKKETGGKRRQAFGEEQRDALEDYFEEHNEATLNEAQQHLEGLFGHVYSLSSIDRQLDKSGFHMKRLWGEIERRNDPARMRARKEWVCQHLGMVNLSTAIFIDEAGFNLHLTRRRGRARTGNRAIQTTAPNRGSNLTLIVACNAQGIIASGVSLASFNRERLVEWLDHDLAPCLDGGETLVMDNVNFHHSPIVLDAVRSWDLSILFLPPYSPQFNLAEWVFGYLKTFISRRQLRTQDGLISSINQQLATITSEHLTGWLQRVRGWMTAAQEMHMMGRTHSPPPPCFMPPGSEAQVHAVEVAAAAAGSPESELSDISML